MEEKININVPQFNNFNIFKIMGLAAFIFLAYNSFYTIDASANGVVLRFGKITSIRNWLKIGSKLAFFVRGRKYKKWLLFEKCIVWEIKYRSLYRFNRFV